MMRTMFLAALLAAALPAAAHAEPRLPKSLLAMSPDAFRDATRIDNDPLEHHATFSTEKAHREGWGWLKPDGHDNHLRAIVDKRTGATRYEIRTNLRYYGTQRDYRAAHYATSDGLRRADLSLTRHGQEPCATNDNNNNFTCALTKTVAFELDEPTMRAIAARHAPGAREGWAFKLKDDLGHDIRSGIAPAEAAGLLQAVDRFRAELRQS